MGESQIVLVNVDVHTDWVQVRVGPPIPFHKFDAFHLLIPNGSINKHRVG